MLLIDGTDSSEDVSHQEKECGATEDSLSLATEPPRKDQSFCRLDFSLT